MGSTRQRHYPLKYLATAKLLDGVHWGVTDAVTRPRQVTVRSVEDQPQRGNAV